MNLDLAGKKVFILSDNNGLCRAIEVSLACRRLEILPFTGNSGDAKDRPSAGKEPDLIVVALSLPTSEPAAMLARAAMDVKMDEVPLLVISEKPFGPEVRETRFAHLNFPFDLDSLYDKVEEVLKNGR